MDDVPMLPTGGFKWLTPNQINELDILLGYSILILEEDLEYPHELHDLHNDYPLATEKTKATKDMLSPYCRKIQEKYNVSIGQVNKLVPTLANKEKYVLHYRNLELYMSLGLKLKTTHRALEFNQSSWLAQYINYNTKKRMQAKNAFEKDFFKLLNNSVFGKTIENLWKRCDPRLATGHKKFLKMVSKPRYVGKKEFTKDLMAVHKIKDT